MADIFGYGGKFDGSNEDDIKELYAKIERLSVENDLSQELKR